MECRFSLSFPVLYDEVLVLMSEGVRALRVSSVASVVVSGYEGIYRSIVVG